MSFDFKKNQRENKAQWHFSNNKECRGYETIDEDINSDVLGSYTGTGYDDLRPVQDADDL